MPSEDKEQRAELIGLIAQALHETAPPGLYIRFTGKRTLVVDLDGEPFRISVRKPHQTRLMPTDENGKELR